MAFSAKFLSAAAVRGETPPRPKLGLSVGITGHRPPLLDEEAEAAMRPVVTQVLRELATGAAELKGAYPWLFDDAPLMLRFVSALAAGADRFGATIALETGYALHAILPLPRADYRQDFDGPVATDFDLLLDRADCVLELAPQKSGRDESYALAGRATIAHCDVLIALWDGGPARGSGGTAEVVSLALRRGIPVIHLAVQPEDPGRILWTGYGEFIDPSDLESMPYRAIDEDTLRDLARVVIGPPGHPKALADLSRYLRERERRIRPRAEYPLMLAVLGIKRLRRSTFTSHEYREATRAEWLAFRTACGPEHHGVCTDLTGIEQSFAWADRLAQHFGQTYRSGHVLNFTFAAAAVLIALTGLLLPQFAFPLAIAEPTVIAIFVVNTFVGSRQQWHRRWLEYRQLAERLRPMRSLKLLGAASPPIAGRQGGGQASSWIEWYAQAEWRAGGSPSGRLIDPVGLARAIIREELDPQIQYNHVSAHQMHVLDHRLHRAGILLFCLSILSCFLSMVANFTAHGPAALHFMFIAAAAGLPAMGAAIFGIRMQGDFCSTADRSLMTADDLSRIANALASPAISLSRQTDLIEAAAATMLADVAEWRRAYNLRTLQLG